MPKLTGTFSRAAVVLSLLTATLTLSAGPASAHTLDEAVRSSAGCGWSGSYSTLHSSPITTSSGARYGTAYLLWHGASGENCAVTLKTGSLHGVVTRTSATLAVQGGREHLDSNDYAHFAAAHAPARGRCVQYVGVILNTSGTIANGGRTTWGNCG